MFVARDPAMALSPLRDLLREDADWNLLLSDITERATDAVEQLSKFEESFSGAPEDVPVSLLEPKMSAIAHRSPSAQWHPENATTVYGADQLLGAPSRPARTDRSPGSWSNTTRAYAGAP